LGNLPLLTVFSRIGFWIISLSIYLIPRAISFRNIKNQTDRIPIIIITANNVEIELEKLKTLLGKTASVHINAKNKQIMFINHCA